MEHFAFPKNVCFGLQATFMNCWLATKQLCLSGPSYSNRTVIKISLISSLFHETNLLWSISLNINCQKPCLYFSSATLHFSLKCSSTDSDFFFSHNSWISGSSLFARTISSISLWLNFLYLSSSSCLTSLHIVLAFSRSSFVRYTFPTPRVACSTE